MILQDTFLTEIITGTGRISFRIINGAITAHPTNLDLRHRAKHNSEGFPDIVIITKDVLDVSIRVKKRVFRKYEKCRLSREKILNLLFILKTVLSGLL